MSATRDTARRAKRKPDTTPPSVYKSQLKKERKNWAKITTPNYTAQAKIAQLIRRLWTAQLRQEPGAVTSFRALWKGENRSGRKLW